MTPAAKIVYFTALVVGLSLGLLFEYRYRTELFRGYSDSKFMTAPWALRDFSREQYAHADFAHAKVALLSYANLLEEMEKARPDEEHKSELSYAYTHLALLEDDAGNAEQSREFMMKARYWRTAYGGPDLSDNDMKAILMKFDDKFELSRSQPNSR